MNEHSATVTLKSGALADSSALFNAALAAGAFGRIPSVEEKVVKMAAKSMATSSLSLVTLIKKEDGDAIDVTVNSEKLMFGSLLLKDVKTALEALS